LWKGPGIWKAMFSAGPLPVSLEGEERGYKRNLGVKGAVAFDCGYKKRKKRKKKKKNNCNERKNGKKRQTNKNKNKI
jgi:hypothetical protein